METKDEIIINFLNSKKVTLSIDVENIALLGFNNSVMQSANAVADRYGSGGGWFHILKK